MNDSHMSQRIEPAYIGPLIWRRVIVPAKITLPRLSEVMLAAMGWQNYHLHEFHIEGVRYGVPDPDGFDVAMNPVDEAGMALAKVLGEAKEFIFHYDFEAYGATIWNNVFDAVYQHVFQAYRGRGESVYH